MIVICRYSRLLATLACLVPAVVAPAAENEGFLPEDAIVSGAEMHTFTADGEPAAVILGDFEMTIGGRRLRGRDAVLWIDETVRGGRSLRTIELYIEGAAEIVEPGGAVTTDRAMLVTIRHRGKLRSDVGRRFDQNSESLPVYKRAVAMRAGVPIVPTPVEPVEPAGPEVTAPVPAPAQAPLEAEPAAAPDAKPRLPLPVRKTKSGAKPIQFQAESTRVIQTTDDAGRTEQVAVCKGDVYIFRDGGEQIPPMEIQADGAVVFTVTDAEDGSLAGGGGAMGLANARGVYLEGDVRLTSGERIIRGSQLYYDFVNEQAIIVDAVVSVVHPRRNIPLYIRAKEIRMLTERTDGDVTRRDMLLTDARISTSEFYTPTYHIGAARAVFSDTTPYNQAGEPTENPSYEFRGVHSTVNVRGVPVLYLPWTALRVKDAELPIHRLQGGHHGRFGLGVESRWRLFQLLGLVEPKGVNADLNVDTYRKGTVVGTDVEYARGADRWGILQGVYVRDHQRTDAFGRDREDVPAPKDRGRLLWRHKEFLTDDWQLQAEASYLSDKNFLESYYRDEFWGGKEQETLLYARKQVDHWAFSALVKNRLRDFQTVSEAYPDFAFHLVGESLLDDSLTIFSESHVGALRLQQASGSSDPGSGTTSRVDSRLEVNAPMHWGPVNITPFLFGRGSYWSRAIDRTDLGRGLAGGGVKANMSFWRVYNTIESRLWDIHRLRHIVTPEVVGLGMASNVTDSELFPFTDGIERDTEAFQGVRIGLGQRWQTYRGAPGDRRPVEFAHVNVYAALFNDTKDPGQPADGRFFFTRPENSITRNALNGEMAVNISDASAFLADINYDLNDKEIGIANFGLAIQRDPRLRYYVGSRYIDDYDSWMWTAGLNYKINKRYEFSGFQQYDMDFSNGTNVLSQFSMIRKFPRWYVAFSVVIDRVTDDVSYLITLWPEGMPNFRIGGPRAGTWAASDMN